MESNFVVLKRKIQSHQIVCFSIAVSKEHNFILPKILLTKQFVLFFFLLSFILKPKKENRSNWIMCPVKRVNFSWHMAASIMCERKWSTTKSTGDVSNTRRNYDAMHESIRSVKVSFAVRHTATIRSKQRRKSFGLPMHSNHNQILNLLTFQLFFL